MAVADEELRAREARCGRHLARLTTLIPGQEDMLPGTGIIEEVTDAATAILIEAQAAADSLVAGTPAGQRPRVTEFLTVRLARLEAAADQAVTAARREDTAALRCSLHRFRALTAALWTVHQAVPMPLPDDDPRPCVKGPRVPGMVASGPVSRVRRWRA